VLRTPPQHEAGDAIGHNPHPEEAQGAVSKDGRPQETDEMSAYLYILRCADGSYYVGTSRGSLERRIAEHHAGAFDGYTARRRPVTLVFHQQFERVEDAVSAERQVKGWRREKKEALIRGDFAALPSLSRRAARRPCVLRDALLRSAPQDKVSS
jgi:putative endonuclease